MNNDDFIKNSARVMAEYELNRLPEEEINNLAKKERNYTLFCYITLIFFFIGLIGSGVALITLGSYNTSFIFFIMILAFFPLGVFIWFLKKNKNKGNRDFAFDKLERKFLMNHKLIDNEIVSKFSNDFNSKREISISNGLFSKNKIIIDNNEKYVQFELSGVKTRKYKFEEILKYEVIENGDSVVKGTAGKALVGGLFFGLGGALIGSASSKKINNKCNDLSINIYLNDISTPNIILPIIKSEILKNSAYYTESVSLAKSVCGLLEFAINQKEITGEENFSEPKSDKEKLKELKEMFEEGLVSEEEYNQKKKQILDI